MVCYGWLYRWNMYVEYVSLKLVEHITLKLVEHISLK